MNHERWTTIGSVASAAASSACCWLPLLMVATGFSAAGAATFFAGLRPIFLVIAVILLGTGFYLNYRPQRTACAPDGSCPPQPSRFRRWNLGMLWASAVVVAALALFPGYVGWVVGAPTVSTEGSGSSTLVLQIEGMTCAGCETSVEAALLELPEVSAADVSYDLRQGVVQLAGGTPPSEMALKTAIGKAGYTLLAVTAQRERPIPGKRIAGQWVTQLKEPNGDMIEMTMDLGQVNGRWVGEFDLIQYGVEDYPVEVIQINPRVRLFFTAMGTAFEGDLSEDGMALEGIGRVGDEEESLVFQRVGEAAFSEDFLELEAAADDPSLVARVSDDGAELRERFNADVTKTRLLMLLSPT